MVRATFVYVFLCSYILIMAPVVIVWTLLSRDTRFLYAATRFCMGVAGWMSGLKLDIRGREHLQPDQNYVFMCNHQGNFDGPLLFWATHRNLRAVIKVEMMRLPVLSILFRLTELVPIDRSDPVQAHAAIERAAELLRKGHSFFAFPEGTRSRDGRLGVFKKGVFLMAINSGTPIVPTSIVNSIGIQPPGTYSIRPGKVEVVFHEPIPTEHLSFEDRDRLIQETRTAIASALLFAEDFTLETMAPVEINF
jgi:1-acyl-sn-glycerol-3-phosphate acyltransferase